MHAYIACLIVCMSASRCMVRASHSLPPSAPPTLKKNLGPSPAPPTGAWDKAVPAYAALAQLCEGSADAAANAKAAGFTRKRAEAAVRAGLHGEAAQAWQQLLAESTGAGMRMGMGVGLKQHEEHELCSTVLEHGKWHGTVFQLVP